jgi:hypothetical protein
MKRPPTREIARKTVNAFFPEAEAAILIRFASALIGEMNHAPDPLELVKKTLGGLWVGGTLVVTDEDIRFQPNLANKLAHGGDVSVQVPMKEVRGAKSRFGVITRIVDIETTAGTFSVRCYGADALAAAIQSAARAA